MPNKICLLATSFAISISSINSARADPATIAAISTIVGIAGSIFGGKAAEAQARARQKQYQELVARLDSLSFQIAANTELLEALIVQNERIPALIERNQNQLIVTASAATVFEFATYMVESEFKLNAVEHQYAQIFLANIITKLIEAQSHFYKVIDSEGDYSSIGAYLLSSDALITAYHTLKILSLAQPEENKPEQFKIDMAFSCAHSINAIIRKDEECENLQYVQNEKSFFEIPIENEFEKSIELLNNIIPRIVSKLEELSYSVEKECANVSLKSSIGYIDKWRFPKLSKDHAIVYAHRMQNEYVGRAVLNVKLYFTISDGFPAFPEIDYLGAESIKLQAYLNKGNLTLLPDEQVEVSELTDFSRSYDWIQRYEQEGTTETRSNYCREIQDFYPYDYSKPLPVPEITVAFEMQKELDADEVAKTAHAGYVLEALKLIPGFDVQKNEAGEYELEDYKIDFFGPDSYARAIESLLQHALSASRLGKEALTQKKNLLFSQ